MFETLKSIFHNAELKKIDDNRIDITKTDIYDKIVEKIPELKEIFDLGRKVDETEFNRTLRHTFRVLYVYFNIVRNKYKPAGNLSEDDFNTIRKLIKNINDENQEILPCIFLYHDIGKPFNQREHPKESAKIVDKYELTRYFNLNNESIIAQKVIEYHLLMGTINNGEASLWSLINFINDPKTQKITKNEILLDLFLDLSVIFAVIDIWGYPYGLVNENYLNQYFNLRNIFSKLLSIKNKKDFFSSLNELCFERIDWRISSAIRIFQYYNSKSSYSKSFFLNKIFDAIKRLNGDNVEIETWNEYKLKNFSNIPRVQLKYGLPIMMRLALGSFKKRKWKIDENTKVQTDLIVFWRSLDERIAEFIRNRDVLNLPIDVVWEGLPHWKKYDKKIIEIFKGKVFQEIIEHSVIQYDEQENNYNLILNFRKRIENIN
ncbi:MAG: HD domain-containing protein [Candidatus Lokiarchaeota archaeon]|nr:HD domain-containing protein [Candidatus Lokiarchaeota archaeon]